MASTVGRMFSMPKMYWHWFRWYCVHTARLTGANSRVITPAVNTVTALGVPQTARGSS